MIDEDIPPEVYKVIGAPGTGKTTRVVGNPEIDNHTSLVQQNLEEYPWMDQMIVTYTNAGVDEAAERLEKIIDQPKYKINGSEGRVTTIHSECYSILNEHPQFNGLDREQVVQHWDKKNFCDIYDMEYGWDDDEDDIMSADKAEGNAFFDIYGWCKSNRVDIENYEECPQPWEGSWGFPMLARRWNEWKEERNKIDFTDMIEKVVEMGRDQLENLGWGPLFPDEDMPDREFFNKCREDSSRDPEVIRGKGSFVDTKVLYVDEVQDLTPLQWDWYLLQKLVCEKVYIGGDDDQTIYGWAGANPDFMLDEEGDFEVLDKTYRIPKNVWEVCDGVINQVEHRQEKDVEPHGDGGEVHTLKRPAPRKLMEYMDDGSVFCLFRARYMIDEFTDDLIEYGIPYDNMSTFDTWDDDIVTLRDGLAKIHNDEQYISGDELQTLQDYIDDSNISKSNGYDQTERVMGNLGGTEVERVKEIFDLSDNYGSKPLTVDNYLLIANNSDNSSEELNYYQKEAIKNNIKRGNEDMYPERVKLGTIHSAKGKEAETVILALDSTQTILQNMEEDTMGNPNKNISDAERRVYYVGMSRASERLVLAEGVVNPGETIPLDELLEDHESDDEWVQADLEAGSQWD